MTITKYLFVVVFVVAVILSKVSASDLDDSDRQAMRDAASLYADAWLSNDPSTVMATFVDEPVLSPSGLQYLEGQEAARAFWFPADGPATKVIAFELNEIEASGSGNIGYVRGTFRLAFEYDGSSYENQGKYVTILRKSAGNWRITHHIWDDLPNNE